MGNAQSDSGEEAAFQIIRHIPILNLGYGGVRSIVYAGKGDTTRAVSSITETITGTIPLLGGLVGGGPWSSLDEIRSRAKPGDILEFHYGWYGHYALYLGNGEVMDVPGHPSNPKVTICVHSLYSASNNGGPVRISNHDDIAHKHFDNRKPRSQSDILQAARSYEGRSVDYQFTLRNCEYYCTLWRFGKGFSTQVARFSKTPNGEVVEDIGALFPVAGVAFGMQEIIIMDKYKKLSD